MKTVPRQLRPLGFLRQLNRQHDVVVGLVHHMAKRARQDPGQALRGSSDLHAWTDSACYLAHCGQQLRLNNARLGDALHTLEQRRLVIRGAAGWCLPDEPKERQLSLSG